MRDQDKAKEQLIDELKDMRQTVSVMAATEARLLETEKTLRESEELHRVTIANISDTVLITDHNGAFTYVCPNTHLIFGYSQEEVEALGNVSKLLGHEPHDAFQRASQQEIQNIDCAIKDKFGKQHALLVNIKRVDIKGGTVLYTCRDVTDRKVAEDALRAGEERLSLTLHVSNAGRWEWNIERDEVCFDARFHEMLGYTMGELPTSLQEWLPYHHPGDMPIWMSKAEAYLRGDSPIYESEHRIRTKAGTWAWVFTRGKLVNLTTTGSPKQFIGMAIDITDRKRAEEALRTSEVQLSNAVMIAHLGPWEYDVTKDLFTFNDHFYKLFRTTAEQVGGYTMSSAEYARRFVHPDDMSVVCNEIRKSIEATDPDFSQRLEHRIVYADGEIGHISVRIFLVKDELGRTVRTYGVNQDITDRKQMEQSLTVREQEYRTLVENIPDLIVRYDTDLRRIYVNPAWEKASGLSAADVINVRATDIPKVSNPINVEYVEKLRQVLETGTPQAIEFTWVNAQGVPLFLDYVIVPEYDLHGKIVRALAVGHDLTERRRAEEALHESDHMLKAILSTSPVGIALTKKRIIAWANDAWRQMFGFKNEQEYLGQSAKSLYASEKHYDLAGKELYRDLETGKVCETDTVFKRKDGSVFDAHVKMKALDRLDPAKGSISAVSDMSSRRRAEEVQRRLATAIEQSVELIIITDASRNIQYVNPAFERITGYTLGEIIGKTPKLLKSDEHDKAFYKKMLDTIRSGEAWRGRIISRKKDGTLFHEDVVISPVRDKVGNIINYVDVGHDVSHEVLLQNQFAQAQKMEAVGTLAGGVAHDFNNILTVVMGYSELLFTEKGKQDPAYADLQKINQAAQKGADLVRRLLTFSRKAEFKPCPVNLNLQIEQLEKMLTRTIPKMVKIELNLADGLARVHADPSQLDQVLMNLAVNARDAMPEGGRLTIETANVFLDEEFTRTHLGVKPGEYVLLNISDTGYGMDKETLQHIFEPFYTTKEAGKGTGLGLAMVYGIVKQHGGYITCYSEPGEGTTFRIYLPVVETEIDQDVATTGTMPAFGTETILLVDDEEFIRDLGKQILKRSGYTVLTATDGKEALDLYRREREKISLVILDLIMPEMGGRQCLDELLKIDPKARVLIASGFAANGQTRAAMETGAKGLVDKPYSMKKMLQAVREVLDGE